MTEAQGRRTAALIVAHGERGGKFDNELLRSLSKCVSAMTDGIHVAAGVLNGDPGLDDALEGFAAGGYRELLVYPFFMSGGYFSGKVLPDRIGAKDRPFDWRVLDPLGLDGSLPEVILEEGLEGARREGWRPADTRLLLVGHGSTKSRASADAADLVARAVADRVVFGAVETAFIEEPPMVLDALKASMAPTVVIGLFSGHGLHAQDDMAEALSASGVPAVYTGPIGAARGIAGIIACALRRELCA